MRLLLLMLLTAQVAFGITPERLPRELRGIPFGEDIGLIRDVKEVCIPKCPCAYNASLIAYKDYYKIFFRFDTPVLPPFTSQLGVASLDKNFDPMDEVFTILSTKSDHSEDPRAFWCRDSIYLSYSDICPGSSGKISIHLAKLNSRTNEVEDIANLDVGLHRIEKNWTPFVDHDAIMYLHYIYPQKVLALEEEGDEKAVTTLHVEAPAPKRSCYWNKCYGQIRGGTPGVPISDTENLAFFHSAFLDQQGFRWYVMGAYVFESTAPYKILRISKQPILYHSIYESWTYHRDKYCMFPAGIVVEEDRVIVSCGENDATIKIVTFDKEKLLESLVKAVPQERAKFSRFN